MAQLWQQKKQGIESVFDVSLFDVDDWLEASGALPDVALSNDVARDEIGGNPVQDSFFSLFKASPQFSDAPRTSALKGLIERGMKTPNYESLRNDTVGQQVASAIGAQHFVERVLSNLPDDVKDEMRQQAQRERDADDAQDHASDTQGQAQAQQALADLLSEMSDDAQEQGDDEKAQDLQTQAQQAQEQAQDLMQQAGDAQEQADNAASAAIAGAQGVEQTLDNYDSEIKSAANHAAQEAREKANDAQDMVKAFSLAAGGDPKHVDPATAKLAMQALKLNPNLQALAEMLGWARKMTNAEWRKHAQGNAYMTGYAPEPLNPSRMASSELVAMVSKNRAVRADFRRRVIENEVIHKQFSGGESQASKGDMIIIRDESESMSWNGGRPHATALALEWALLEIARRENRGFYSIPFSGENQQHTWEAPKKGALDAQSLYNHLAHFYCGGTEPYAPLRTALDIVEQGDVEGDILMLTDEDFGVIPDDLVQRVKQVRESTGVKIVAVVIGVGAGMGHGEVEKFADAYIRVADLIDDRNRLKDAIRQII